MRTVHTFWWHPEEETDFLRFLEGTGYVVALPFDEKKDPQELTSLPIVDFLSQSNPSDLFFALEEHARKLVITSFEKTVDEQSIQVFRVSSIESCVIDYERCQLTNYRKLTPVNFCAYWDYPDMQLNKMIKKPPEFVAWGKKVMRWIHKLGSVELLPYDLRMTKRVKEEVLDGKLELVKY